MPLELTLDDVEIEGADGGLSLEDVEIEEAPQPKARGGVIRAHNRGLIDQALDLVPNRERLSEGIPGIISGAVQQGSNVVRQGGDMLRAGWNMLAPDSLDVDRPYQREGDIPASTPYQQLGQRGVQAAELASGAKGVVSAAKGVPGVMAKGLGISKTRAAQNLGAAAEAAKGAAVNAEMPGQVALRIGELGERGASVPRVVQRFAQRITDPNKGPLTFEEARDYYSNISRLSASDYSKLNGPVKRELAQMKQYLDEAIKATAEGAGKGKEYASGMKEYARAAKAQGMLDDAKDIVTPGRVAKYGLGLGAGSLLLDRLLGSIGSAK
jgi:hypothetical protein